jgi:hypothetical protein
MIMAFFYYIWNITYYLLFASVAGIFAPAGKYRKFVSLVMGFVLLLLLIQPIERFLDDIPVSGWCANAMQMPAGISDYTSAERWEGHLRDSFESQLTAQLSRHLSANDFALHSANFFYTQDFSEITEIRVVVSVKEPTESGRVPFIRIQSPEFRPIRIGEDPPAETCAHTQTVKNLISQFYNLPMEHIFVEVRYL